MTNSESDGDHGDRKEQLYGCEADALKLSLEDTKSLGQWQLWLAKPARSVQLTVSKLSGTILDRFATAGQQQH